MCKYPVITSQGVKMAHPIWEGYRGSGLAIFVAASPPTFHRYVAFGSVRSEDSPLIQLEYTSQSIGDLEEPTALP